ncbi:MAG: efflux RND transporter periplasmic adaptor subunit [Butyrivibrio sp.]|nr:efflux RND transporter periplasmic adaptor subunit [Butyrivibrio sp.]
MKLKELGTKIKSFIIIRKVPSIIFVVILSASIAGGAVYHSISSPQTSAGAVTDYKTFEVKKTDLEKNLSVTGTVISSEENTANASTSTSYPVASVKVKVGDTVKTGDILYTLDMTSVKNDMNLQKETLTLQQASAGIADKTAKRQLEEAKVTGNQQMTDAARSLRDSQDDTVKAITDQQTATINLANLKSKETVAKASMDQAFSRMNDLKNKYDSLKSSLEKAKNAAADADARLTYLNSKYTDEDAKKKAEEDAKAAADKAAADKAAADKAAADKAAADKAAQNTTPSIDTNTLTVNKTVTESPSTLPNTTPSPNVTENTDQNSASKEDNAKTPDPSVTSPSARADFNAQKTISFNGALALFSSVDRPDLSSAQGDARDKDLAATNAQTAFTPVETQYNEAKTDYEQKKADYDTAVANRKTAEDALKSANSTLTGANRTMQTATSSATTSQRTANSSIEGQKENLSTARINGQSSTLSTKEQIRKYEDELKKGIVTATMDGTITNVNVSAGQTYSGTNAIVIDNVEKLKATADVDEAQISNIANGMKVRVKTDATGDTTLNGTVVFVSPTATKNTSSSATTGSSTASVAKTRATYRVDVNLETADKRLRLGMTAKMNFILDSKTGCIAVPSSDITTADDGSKTVTVLSSDGTVTSTLPVKTGLENDYYTEITSGNLKEGSKIIENQDSATSASSTVSEMGALGGIN